MTLNCFKCQAEVVFDSDHIGKNGKKIPLDPATHAPHDCPLRSNSGTAGTRYEPGQEDKDDHGNESFTSIPVAGDKPISPKEYVEKLGYVDHTTAAKGIPQFKVFSHTSADIITVDGNEWIKTHPQYQVKLIGQLQFDNGIYAITIYYEEVANQ